MLSRIVPISQLAATHQVSRKFIYQQGNKAQQALDESFAPSQGDDDVLFYLPVTKNWLFQLIVGLILICHSSYRGVVELFRDLLDLRISVGTVHNRMQETAKKAVTLNQSQELSRIEVGLQDEIFHADKPVLVGIDAASTYCYLLQSVDHRDGDTWGYYLLDVMEQGFAPAYRGAASVAATKCNKRSAASKIPKIRSVFISLAYVSRDSFFSIA